jgi:nuclear transport factor 2 (NTF2) superfamily protein
MANPTEVKTRWTEYFREQLGKKEDDDNEDEELKVYERTEDVERRTYSNRSELVNGRNRPEMLIHAGLELKEDLYKLIKQIWEEESIPLA